MRGVWVSVPQSSPTHTPSSQVAKGEPWDCAASVVHGSGCSVLDDLKGTVTVYSQFHCPLEPERRDFLAKIDESGAMQMTALLRSRCQSTLEK